MEDIKMNTKRYNNPIFEGWYADPEARYYEGKYWIYVTRSDTDFSRQQNLDAFSSEDLVHWEKHESIVDMRTFPWARSAVWAPTIIDKDGKYYLVFAINDIQSDEETGGLCIGVSDSPAGPFRNSIGGILVDHFVNGAQPIDAHLFDDGEKIYLYFGGWRHCNVAVMKDTMDGFEPFPDGSIFREITPEGYVEGPCMLKRGKDYHFMWSEGNWMNGTYRVCTSRWASPVDPGKEKKTILTADSEVADGPGHHGYLQIEGSDEFLIVYHCSILGDAEPGHRVVCIDRLLFDEAGDMEKVVMTKAGELPF